jgi:hypothetical protein
MNKFYIFTAANLLIVKKLLPYYAFFIGFALLIIRVIISLSGNFYENKAELVYHILPEISIAVFCVSGALLLFANRKRGKIYTLAGMSMGLYSSLYAAGYYIHDAPLFLLFNGLTIGTLPFLIHNMKSLINAKTGNNSGNKT